MKKIILASGSPRRKEILTMARLEFDCINADIDESRFMAMSPATAVTAAATEKAMNVADRLHEPAVVIGADTVVYAGELLGKPQNEDDAFRMLRLLAGREHTVYTGVSVVESDSAHVSSRCFTTYVSMADMSDEEILDYIQTGEPMDKAGTYAVQGIASKFIREIRGCFFNVMGLPVSGLRDMLKEFDIKF